MKNLFTYYFSFLYFLVIRYPQLSEICNNKYENYDDNDNYLISCDEDCEIERDCYHREMI